MTGGSETMNHSHVTYMLGIVDISLFGLILLFGSYHVSGVFEMILSMMGVGLFFVGCFLALMAVVDTYDLMGDRDNPLA